MTYSRRFWTCFNWFFVVDFHTPFLCGLTDGFIGGWKHQSDNFTPEADISILSPFFPNGHWGIYPHWKMDLYLYGHPPAHVYICIHTYLTHVYTQNVILQGGGGKDLQILGPCGYLWYPHETPTTCRFQRFKVLSGNGNSYGYMDLGRCAKPLATEGTVYWGSFSFSREDGVRTRVIFLACLRTSTRSFVLEK